VEVRIYMEAFYLENFHELDYVKGILMLNLNGAHVSLVAVMYKVSCEPTNLMTPKRKRNHNASCILLFSSESEYIY
jgi:hypothetical protein